MLLKKIIKRGLFVSSWFGSEQQQRNKIKMDKMFVFFFYNVTIDSFTCSLCIATVSEGYKPESLHARTEQETCIKKQRPLNELNGK